MKTKHLYLRLILAAVVLALTVWYCKNDPAGKTAAAHPGDKHGNTLNIRLEAPANTLNPYLSASAYPRYVAAKVFQTLGDNDPETFALVPLIVKAIPSARMVNEGPYKGSLAYDFEIVPEAVWDNGSPVTGHDFIFSMKVQLDPLLPLYNFGGYLEYLQNIEVDPANPKKFTVYFDRYYILALETLCQMPILPVYNYDPQNLLGAVALPELLDPKKAQVLAQQNTALRQFSDFFQQPKFANDPSAISGSGPYRPESIGNDQTVLVKKQNWWGDAMAAANPFLAARPDRLVYKIVRDEAAVENMLRTGDLDVALTISPANFLRMRDDSLLAANYDFETRWSPQYNRWLFDLRSPKLADKRVRQALAHVVDYDYILKTLQLGLGERTVGPVHPNKTYYAKNITPYDYNIQTAKDLLAQAGWTDSDGDGIVDKMINGRRTQLSLDVLATTSNRVTEQLAASTEQSARNAGIKLNIVPVDLPTLSGKTKNEMFETAMMGVAQHPGLNELFQNYHSKSVAPAGDNRSRLLHPQLDKIIETIRTTADETTRNELYLQAQQILHEEVPEVFMYAPKQRYIGSKRFEHVFSSNRPGFYEGMFKLKGPYRQPTNSN